MKTKFPPQIRFKEYADLFETVKSQKGVNPETKEMVQARKRLLDFLKSNEKTLHSLELLMVQYRRLYIINNVTKHTYLAIQKGKNEYNIARVKWPDDTGNDIEIRISLGAIKTGQRSKKVLIETEKQKLLKHLIAKL
jgi:hypothetical protein